MNNKTLPTISLVIAVIALCFSVIPIINIITYVLSLVSIVIAVISLIKKYHKILSILTIVFAVTALCTSQGINYYLGTLLSNNVQSENQKQIDVEILDFEDSILNVRVTNNEPTKQTIMLEIEAVDKDNNRLESRNIIINNLGHKQATYEQLYFLKQLDDNVQFKVASISSYEQK